MVFGDAFFTHVAHEIPDLCESLFPLVPDDAHRYIAGNSMGGYGAFKIALKNPDKFAKAAAFSGVLDINQMIRDFPQYERDWQLCFGGNHAPAEEDVLKLLPQAKQLPELYHYSGTDDFLAEGNHNFCELCEKLDIPLTSTWEEGGTHSWLYWENQLPIMLRWLVQE